MNKTNKQRNYQKTTRPFYRRSQFVMEDSIRFADQSKALWLQQNLNGSGLGSGELLSENNTTRYSHVPKKDSCIDRCPFASIIAMVITGCGTGVFCGCLYRALSITILMLTTAFKIELTMEWVGQIMNTLARNEN